MSVTYSIVCDECKVKCWVGQSGYIYQYKYIDNFLKEHIGHKLRYIADECEDKSDDYEDYYETNDLLDVDVATAKNIVARIREGEAWERG